ncbi:response regulator [Candidatus Sumerlaeota bacterium]|nr:response regulator [Candidatus Sumerlaeota bacterium]
MERLPIVRSKFFNMLEFRLGASFAALAIIIGGLFMLALLYSLEIKLRQDMMDRLSDAVRLATANLNVELHATLTSPEQEESAAYESIQSYLEKIHDSNTKLIYLYTMRQDQEGIPYFVVDADVPADNRVEIAHWGERYEDPSSEMLEAFTTTEPYVAEKAFTTDEWGTVISAYAPLYTPDGKRDGILGIDMQVNDVIAYQRHYYLIVIALYSIAVLAAIICGMLMGRFLARPIIQLCDGAEALTRGESNRRFECKTSDELGQLAMALNVMAEHAQLERNELNQVLRRQVEKLSKANQALEENEGMLRQITASAQDAIIMTDSQGIVTFWSPAAERIFGPPEQEAVGETLQSLIVPPQEYEAFQLCFLSYLSDDVKMTPGECSRLRSIHSSGRLLTVELSIARLWVRKQRCLLGIFRDVTEREEYETQLRNTKEEAEFLNRDLEQAIARANQLAFEAEAANCAKSEFLANMSHEIRTPMNGIIGMSNLLLDTELNSEQFDFAKTIVSSAESLLRLINDILDFSKIEAGKLDLEYIEFDLRKTIEEMSDALAFRAHEKNLELVCVIDTKTPSYLQGDPGRLRQIITNLIGNAIKFTHQGDVTLNVAVREESDDKTELLFEVHDTGIGIQEDQSRKLFQAFTQADSSTTRKYGGTGLGLAICRQLAEKMEGEIGARNNAAGGATFWFTARLRKLSAKRVQELQQNSAAAISLNDVRVLLVETSETSRRMLRLYLTEYQCQVDDVSNPSAALDKIRQAVADGRPYAIALLAMQLPDMSGDELGEQIKQDPAICGTRLISLTSFGKRGDAKRLEKIGFSAYLTKPVKPSHLRECLHEVLSEKHDQTGKPREQLITRHSLREKFDKRFHVLLAEDNLVNQRVAVKVLEKLGCSVDVANDGLEAIEALKRRDYDAVLMDLQMPRLNGLEATQRIRDPETGVRNPQIPVIAMTASAMSDDRHRCLAAGMNDYISKPFKPDTLLEKLQCIRSSAAVRDSSDSERTQALHENAVVFQKDKLRKRLLDDEELVREIVQLFLKESPRLIESLHDAYDQGDHHKMYALAHQIEGSAGSIDADAMQHAAHELSTLAADGGDPRKIKASFEKLIANYSALDEHLKQCGYQSEPTSQTA